MFSEEMLLNLAPKFSQAEESGQHSEVFVESLLDYLLYLTNLGKK